MKNAYAFVCFPNDNGFTLDNPLSSMGDFTLRNAQAWAKQLLRFNTSCERVEFKRYGGRKVYVMENNQITKTEIVKNRSGWHFNVYWNFRALANVVSKTYTTKRETEKALEKFKNTGHLDIY